MLCKEEKGKPLPYTLLGRRGRASRDLFPFTSIEHDAEGEASRFVPNFAARGGEEREKTSPFARPSKT